MRRPDGLNAVRARAANWLRAAATRLDPPPPVEPDEEPAIDQEMAGAERILAEFATLKAMKAARSNTAARLRLVSSKSRGNE